MNEEVEQAEKSRIESRGDTEKKMVKGELKSTSFPYTVFYLVQSFFI